MTYHPRTRPRPAEYAAAIAAWRAMPAADRLRLRRAHGLTSAARIVAFVERLQ